MKILFLDDHVEMLDTYRLIENPKVLSPDSAGGPADLFADKEPSHDNDFTSIPAVWFKGEYFSKAEEALSGFTTALNSHAPFRIAVLDMQLPDTNGIEVARSLLAKDPSLRLIFITAHADWSIHDIARKLEMSQTQFMFIKKPFELQEVLQALLYMRKNIHDTLWKNEALTNLLGFTRDFKVETLTMFDTLFSLETFTLARTVGQKKIPEMLQKNEQVLELVGAIFGEEGQDSKGSFSLDALISDLPAEDRLEVMVTWPMTGEQRIRGNPRVAGFALRALIRNALDFSTGPVWIEFSVGREGLINITVRDIGPGIAAKDLFQMFEPGCSIGNGKTSAGFGLAFVKKIVQERFRGELAARSTRGKGTSFRMSLPIAP